jgi:hypothetical protein
LPDASGGKTGKPDFHEEMDRFAGHMPGWAGRNLKRLRHPRAAWVRVPAGVALTGGGVLSVLPGLGLWMVPVGLALLAHDVPLMRGPLARVLRYTNIKIEQRRERRRNAAPKRAPAAPQSAAPGSRPAAMTAAKPATKGAARPAAKAVAKPAAKIPAKTPAKATAKTAAKTRSGRSPKT